MVKNLSQIVSSKQTAQNVLARFASPITTGIHRDNSWKVVNQFFRAVRDCGGQIEIISSAYFGEMAGKRWVLSITNNGFTYSGILTASFSDKPNGDLYDLVLTF